MRKPEMEELFDEIHAGMNNVPTLLQPNPERSFFSDLQLYKHEIPPTESHYMTYRVTHQTLCEVQKSATGDILR